LVIRSAGGTDIGRKRGHNEDSFGVNDDLGVYVVADGMGGHAAGEVASRTAVDTFSGFMAATAGDSEITWPFERDESLGRPQNRLLTGIKLANRAICDLAASKQALKGMGTTIVAALVEGDEAYIAHVGDSRAYALSQGSLRQVTSDHSYVEEQVLAGFITPEQARVHPLRNVVTRALGVREDVKVDISSHILIKGDLYMLCSDGLSGMLSVTEIESILVSGADDLKSCVETLIKKANEKGGDDNITAVLFQAV